MSERVYIEIEASPWMDEDGVTTTVFIGDAGEPCYEESFTFKELIDKELEAHTVRGKLTNEYGHNNIDRAMDFVIALQKAAKYAEKRFVELNDAE
jgi:hypothetical protein